MHPNNSFKPTPCRGVSCVLCATLARIRRPATGRLNSGVIRGQTAACVGTLQLKLHPSSGCAALIQSSHRAVFRSRRSPFGETALRAVVRSGTYLLDDAIRTGQVCAPDRRRSWLRWQSRPRAVLAPDSYSRLPIACANKSQEQSHFAGPNMVA
jgi:hypothetical protein